MHISKIPKITHGKWPIITFCSGDTKIILNITFQSNIYFWKIGYKWITEIKEMCQSKPFPPNLKILKNSKSGNPERRNLRSRTTLATLILTIDDV